jgi:hypothetical protein
MKFRVSYKKKEEFEIKELNIDLEFSEKNKTDHPATTIVKIVTGSVIAIIAMAAALAVYGANHGQPKLLGMSDKILEIPHYITDTGRDWLIHLQEKK